jgi:hypothetical protein
MDPTAKRGSVPMSGKSTSRSKLVERALPNDENARQNIMAFAKERIAQHLENGHSFSRATVMEPVRDRPSKGDKEVSPTRPGERARMRERER